MFWSGVRIGTGKTIMRAVQHAIPKVRYRAAGMFCAGAVGTTERGIAAPRTATDTIGTIPAPGTSSTAFASLAQKKLIEKYEKAASPERMQSENALENLYFLRKSGAAMRWSASFCRMRSIVKFASA